jgi:hypothetical protein
MMNNKNISSISSNTDFFNSKKSTKLKSYLKNHHRPAKIIQEAPNSNVYHFFGDSGQSGLEFSHQQSSGQVYCDDSRVKHDTSLASKVKNISGGGVSQLTRHSPHTFSLGQTDSFNHREVDVEH